MRIDDTKSTPANEATYTFVGVPMISLILHVLAATNSDTRYGSGSMCAFFAKQQMNGVNVKMIISFDVKTVSSATVIYKSANSLF